MGLGKKVIKSGNFRSTVLLLAATSSTEILFNYVVLYKMLSLNVLVYIIVFCGAININKIK